MTTTAALVATIVHSCAFGNKSCEARFPCDSCDQKASRERSFILAVNLALACNKAGDENVELVGKGCTMAHEIAEMAWKTLGLGEEATRAFLDKNRCSDTDTAMECLSDCFEAEREELRVKANFDGYVDEVVSDLLTAKNKTVASTRTVMLARYTEMLRPENDRGYPAGVLAAALDIALAFLADRSVLADTPVECINGKVYVGDDI